MKKNINFKRMINFKYKFLLLLFALYFGNKSYAQFVNIDSCLLVLKASKEDTNKVILLDKIAWDISYNNLQKGLDYSILSFELAKKLNYKRKFSNIYNTQGAIYTDMAQHGKAIAAYLEGIKYAKLFKLKKSEAVLLNNLANLFSNNNEKRKALAYYFSSIECSKNIGEPAESTTAFGNIPTVYSFYEKYDSALYYLNKSINYNLIHNRMDFLLTNYTMLSEINYSQGDKINALLSANKAVNIANKLKDSFSLTRAKIAQSNAYSLNKNIPMAISSLIEATKTAKLVGDITSLESCAYNLAELYEKIGDYKSSLNSYKEHGIFKDSIYNKETIEQIKHAEAEFENDKKQKEIELLGEKQKLNDAENQKQKIYFYILCLGILFLGTVLALLYRNNVAKQTANLKLETFNKEINHQKNLVDVKNKEITDSITYAKRIQRSILTSENYFRKYTNDFFILFKPKDIVSGDFYWAINHENKFIVMTADCTGHGVPGAMMSMMGVNFLNEIVNEKQILEPAKILNHLRHDIIKALNPEGSETETKDGMDCSLCSFDFNLMTLTYSNANNNFYIIRNNEIIVSKANKMPVGAGYNVDVLFDEFTIDIKKDDIIISLTDGYIDQFGGDKGKKFKYKNLQELLLQNAHLPMYQIKNKLNDTIEFWKGNLEQVDDICILGIKI